MIDVPAIFDKSNLLLSLPGLGRRLIRPTASEVGHTRTKMRLWTLIGRRQAFGFVPDAPKARAFEVLAEPWSLGAPGDNLTMASRPMGRA